jgi:hypothetical protein
MSTTVTMQDLELETADLLPTGKTPCCCSSQHSMATASTSGRTTAAPTRISALNGGNQSEGLIVL